MESIQFKLLFLASSIAASYGFGYSPIPTPKSRMMYQYNGVISSLQCARLCSEAWPCNITQYCEDSESCTLYAECEDCTANSVNCSNIEKTETKGLSRPERIIPNPLACASHSRLVTGPDGVEDSQLTASSYWCQNQRCNIDPEGLGPKYARLVPAIASLSSSWSTRVGQTVGQWIQVDFLDVKLVTGVILAGRSVVDQYVTAFQLHYSIDCVEWNAFQGEDGLTKIFTGCSFAEDVVTHCFPYPIPVQCFRIYPTEWENYMSLRFEVLGF